MPSITHRVSPELKKRLNLFCEKNGLKAQAVVQEAISSWLDDAVDLTLIEERRTGPWIEWNDIKDKL